MQGASRQRLGILALIAALVASAAMLLLIADYAYGPLLVSSRQEVTRAQVPDTAASAPTANSLDLSMFDRPRDLPEIHFADADKGELTLADFRGKVVLLNIWATWCVPCRKEMPALDRLQGLLGGDDFVVVPLSIDRKGVEAVKPFYEELGLQKLGIYVDASAAASRALAAPGVPTTLLINREGREVARKMGAAEWDGPDMVALIRRQIEAQPAPGKTARP